MYVDGSDWNWRDGARFGGVCAFEFGVLASSVVKVSGAELCGFGHVCRVPRREERLGIGGAECDMGGDCVDCARAAMVCVRTKKAGADVVKVFKIFAREGFVC